MEPGRTERDVSAILSEQRRHQVRFARKRMTPWIPSIFIVGLCVSILGLIPAITVLRETGSSALVFLFAPFTVLFGWAVVAWLIAPFLIRPRIVPYFVRELGPYGGQTMTAFRRGRGLYREIVALERLAETLGVKPLSDFGFAYDHYDQKVRWHSAGEGLRTVEALGKGLGAYRAIESDVAEDLEALAVVIRAAADQDVNFSLVLRLHAKDSMQSVCTREVRQGSFW
jgi:hypothetical protein